MTITLHPHQERAIEGARETVASGSRRLVIQAPTGAGKTVTAAKIILGALAKGRRVVFVVHRLQLVDQTVARLRAAGITEIGVIQADHWMTDWSKPVQVASVQTLQNCRKLPKADLVIIDEVHCWFEFYARWIADPEWANVPFIGLSATPWTKGLGKHFSRLIIAATTQELIDAGFLSPFRVFAPSHPDLAGVRTVAGDFHEGEAFNCDAAPKAGG
jgi:DNA repair protein RadD